MANDKVIIAVSGKKGAGKGTACGFIEDNARLLFGRPVKVGRFPFAGPLKEFCVDVLGLRPEQAYGTNEEKNSPTEYYWENLPHYNSIWDAHLNRAARLALKTCEGLDGSHYSVAYQEEFARNVDTSPPSGLMTAREVMQQVGTMMRMFDEDVWVRANLRAMHSSDCDVCLVDDMRYPNEAEAARAAGGRLIRLTRSPHPGDGHESETALDDYRGFDSVIDNRALSVSETNCVLWDELARLGVVESRGYLSHEHYGRIIWGGE